MNWKQMRWASILVLIAVQSAIPSRAWASLPSTGSSMTTPSEQGGMLLGLASQTLGHKLFPRPVESIPSKPYFQRDYGSRWPSSSLPDRISLSERIGEQGRRTFTEERGYSQILGSQKRGIVQGPDSVYWDPYKGRLRVIDAKGGLSLPKRTFGSMQGTNANSIRSAKYVLASAKTTVAEKLAAARVIDAAQRNRVESGIVRTRHDQGMPRKPQLDGRFCDTNVSEEAASIRRDLEHRNPELKDIFDEARRRNTKDILKFLAAKGIAVVGLASAGILGLDAYEESREAWKMFHDPNLNGTALSYLQVGVAVGRWAETTTVAAGAAAELGLLGQGKGKALGRAVGKRFLIVAVATEGLSGGKAYYEYRIGRIGQRDLYRRSTGPAVFVVFTGGGAVIGGIIGAPAGGVGAAPAAAIGATIGALVAVPFQMGADLAWEWHYKKFDEKQQEAVDRAVERRYESAK